MSGFWIRSLTVSGPGVPDAVLEFTPGVNVLVGPSDTGKTYVYQCLDYMLGAKKKPKAIREAKSYDSIAIELQMADSEESWFLRRSLRGGGIERTRRGISSDVLSEKHSDVDGASLSGELLKTFNAYGKSIRTNKAGGKRTLSFRDVARLSLVGELSILEEISPIYSGQYNRRPAESSIFRYLLTGVDDSSYVESPASASQRAKIQGRKEVLTELTSHALGEAKNQIILGDMDSVQGQLKECEAAITVLRSKISADKTEFESLESQRSQSLDSLRAAERELATVKELEIRFRLLEEQYISDMARLGAIAEAGYQLGRMGDGRCHICGALAEHHDASHVHGGTNPDLVSRACASEGSRIRLSAAELAAAMESLMSRRVDLERQVRDALASVKLASREIRRRSASELDEAVGSLVKRLEEKVELERALSLFGQARDLDERASREPELPKEADSVSTSVTVGEAGEFCMYVERMLHAWSFPNAGRVTFSETEQDVVIDNQPRASHGKGVRAITHSAFCLGLAAYARDMEKPSPRSVVLDSPLIVYEKPDPGETDFPVELKDEFFASLVRDLVGIQVIVIENIRSAPKDVGKGEINLIRFTGNEEGRFGFIPRPG